jgi:hypothetical protein
MNPDGSSRPIEIERRPPPPGLQGFVKPRTCCLISACSKRRPSYSFSPGDRGVRLRPLCPCGSRPTRVAPGCSVGAVHTRPQGGLSRLLSQRSGREQARAARNAKKRVGQLWCCCNTLTILKESLTVERIAWFATQRIQRIGGLPWASLV